MSLIPVQKTITVNGRIPSKKNSTWTIMIKGRPVRLPSQKFKEWHKDASKQLLGTQKIQTPALLHIDFWLPDLRKTDLTNKAESIMDLLVDNGILPDDNCIEVPQLLLSYRGVDRKSPRAEITWLIAHIPQS